MKNPFFKDQNPKPINYNEDIKVRKLEIRIKYQSLFVATSFFCIWLFLNYMYFLLMGTLGFAIFTNVLEITPSWLSYCIGFLFGYFVSKGFFPLGFANDLLKNHWQQMQKYRASLTKSS